MKNSILIVGIFVLIVSSGYLLINTEKSGSNSDSSTTSLDVQKITLSFKDGNYYPQTINARLGNKVSLTLDNSVQGCYRTFTIRDLGVAKYSASPKQPIEFTPSKAGTFKFACGMGMGTGTIIVE